MEKLQAREIAGWKPALLICRLEAYAPEFRPYKDR